MLKLRQYRIFISHAWCHHQHYDRLIERLNEHENFKISDYSIHKDKPINISEHDDEGFIQNKILDHMKEVHIVIVLAGMYANRKWMTFEIDAANQLKKPIIALKPWGQKRVPKAIQDAALEIHGWNKIHNMVTAIRRHFKTNL